MTDPGRAISAPSVVLTRDDLGTVLGTEHAAHASARHFTDRSCPPIVEHSAQVGAPTIQNLHCAHARELGAFVKPRWAMHRRHGVGRLKVPRHRWHGPRVQQGAGPTCRWDREPRVLRVCACQTGRREPRMPTPPALSDGHGIPAFAPADRGSAPIIQDRMTSAFPRRGQPAPPPPPGVPATATWHPSTRGRARHGTPAPPAWAPGANFLGAHRPGR